MPGPGALLGLTFVMLVAAMPMVFAMLAGLLAASVDRAASLPQPLVVAIGVLIGAILVLAVRSCPPYAGSRARDRVDGATPCAETGDQKETFQERTRFCSLRRVLVSEVGPTAASHPTVCTVNHVTRL